MKSTAIYTVSKNRPLYLVNVVHWWSYVELIVGVHFLDTVYLSWKLVWCTSLGVDCTPCSAYIGKMSNSSKWWQWVSTLAACRWSHSLRVGTILHSSNDPGELSYWLSCDDSTITLIWYHYYYYLWSGFILARVVHVKKWKRSEIYT